MEKNMYIEQTLSQVLLSRILLVLRTAAVHVTIYFWDLFIFSFQFVSISWHAILPCGFH